jgi:hypothetical protein
MIIKQSSLLMDLKGIKLQSLTGTDSDEQRKK